MIKITYCVKNNPLCGREHVFPKWSVMCWNLNYAIAILRVPNILGFYCYTLSWKDVKAKCVDNLIQIFTVRLLMRIFACKGKLLDLIFPSFLLGFQHPNSRWGLLTCNVVLPVPWVKLNQNQKTLHLGLKTVSSTQLLLIKCNWSPHRLCDSFDSLLLWSIEVRVNIARRERH